MDTTQIQETITKALMKEFIITTGFEVSVKKNPRSEINDIEIVITGKEYQG